MLLLAAVCTLAGAGMVLYPAWRSGGFRRAIGDGKNPDTYGFDLSRLTIPRETLTASDHAKDALREIPENLVETLTQAEVERLSKNIYTTFLVPRDRVVGVMIGGGPGLSAARADAA